jgi:hypothetical protein
MSITIREATDADAMAWDAVVESSDEAWLFHLYDWRRVLKKGWNFRSFYLLAEKDGQPVGILPLFLKKTLVFTFLDSAGMGYGGPAAVNSCHEKQNVWSALLEKADEIALEQKADWFKVALPPLARAYLPTSGQIINPLILRGFADIPSFGYMVDLTKSEETLWNNLGKKTRILIRKA